MHVVALVSVNPCPADCGCANNTLICPAWKRSTISTRLGAGVSPSITSYVNPFFSASSTKALRSCFQLKATKLCLRTSNRSIIRS